MVCYRPVMLIFGLYLNVGCEVWVLYHLRHADCCWYGAFWGRLSSLSTNKAVLLIKISVIFNGVCTVTVTSRTVHPKLGVQTKRRYLYIYKYILWNILYYWNRYHQNFAGSAFLLWGVTTTKVDMCTKMPILERFARYTIFCTSYQHARNNIPGKFEPRTKKYHS